MIQAGTNRFLGVDQYNIQIKKIQSFIDGGIPAMAIPPSTELAQGFDAIYQFTEQGMMPRIKEALNAKNALYPRMYFQLTDSADERILAAIIEKDIEVDTSKVIEELTTNIFRIQGLVAVSEGLGVIMGFSGISLTELGASPKAILTWSVQVVVQAIQTIPGESGSGESGNIPSITIGGNSTSLTGDVGTGVIPEVTPTASIHRFLETIAKGRFEIEVDISTETDAYAIRAVTHLQDQLKYTLKEGSDNVSLLNRQTALVQKLASQMQLFRETVWTALRDTTDMDSTIYDLLAVLAGQTIPLTPSCSPGGTAGIELSTFSNLVTKAVSTPGNRWNTPVLSLCVKIGSAGSEDLLGVKPFCGSSNCAYLANTNVLSPVIAYLWSSSQSPSKAETIHDVPAEFEYDDGSTGTGSVDLVLSLKQLQSDSLEMDIHYLMANVTIYMKVVKAIDPDGNEVSPPYPEYSKLTEWHLYPFKSYAELNYSDPGEGVAANWHIWLTAPMTHPFRTAQSLSKGSSRFYSYSDILVMRCNVRES